MKESEKFKTTAPLPTDRERETLIILMEEALEVVHRASKALRFGLSEIQPGQPYTNAARISREVGDFFAVAALAVEEKTLFESDIMSNHAVKGGKLAKYMQTKVESW